MRKMLLVSLSLLTAVSLAACSKEEGNATKKAGTEAAKKDAGAPAAKKVDGFIGVIRDAKLDALPTNTIGGAFDRYQYFETRDWTESRGTGGRVVVDFYAKLKDSSLSEKDRQAGVIGRGLDVKFVINADGSYAVAAISRYDNKPGGKVESYAVADFGTILPKIYADKVLVF